MPPSLTWAGQLRLATGGWLATTTLTVMGVVPVSAEATASLTVNWKLKVVVAATAGAVKVAVGVVAPTSVTVGDPLATCVHR